MNDPYVAVIVYGLAAMGVLSVLAMAVLFTVALSNTVAEERRARKSAALLDDLRNANMNSRVERARRDGARR